MFKVVSTLLYSLPMLCLCALTANAQNVVLDQNSNIVIERRGAAAQDLDLAAAPLQKYLLLALKKTALEGSGATVNFVLDADAQTWQQLKPQSLQNPRDIDAFEIKISATPQPQILIHGATVLATSYGVLHFLEERLGVMWLFPGELGLALPRQTKFVLPSGNQRIVPQVASRVVTSVDMGGPDSLPFRQKYAKDSPLFDERIFFAASDYFKSLRLHPLISPSHNMINIFPVKETVEKNPDLLPLKADGTRYNPLKEDGAATDPRRLQHWHPCYSHPKAAEIAITKARTAFQNGVMCFSLGINDGLRQQCQCENCKRLGWPNSYYQFVTKVANAVKDEYPPHMIGVLVYGDVRHPPADLRLPDNVLAMITGSNMLEKWSKHAKHIGNYQYLYGEPFIIPSFPLKAMVRNANEFEKHGVASWRAELRPNWAWDAPKIYLQTRLLWNPKLDANAVLARWCNAAFGEGGPELTRFYLHWARKWVYLAELNPNDFAPLVAMAKWNSSNEQMAMCTPEDFAFSAAALARAKAVTKGELERKRLQMVETNFEYARALFEMNTLAQTTFASDAPQNVSELLAALQQKRARSEALQDEMQEHKEWREGTKEYERRSSFTIDKEIHSAMLTAFFKLRESGKVTAEAQAALPRMLQEYSGALTAVPVPRIEALDKGIYYAVDYIKHMYSPMSAQTKGDTLTARAALPNEIIEEGARAGEYRQHWVFALLPRRVAPGRGVFRVEFTVKAKNGTTGLRLENPWRVSDDDGLPINVPIAFDKTGGEQKRVVYIEPVFPGSANKGTPGDLRFIALWTPQGEDADCEITAKFTQINVAPKAGA